MSKTEKTEATADDNIKTESKKEVSSQEAKLSETPQKPGFKQRLQNFKNWFVNNKKKSIPISVGAILLLIAIIPQTRYLVPGLFITKDVSITVENSQFDSGVSEAEVNIAGKTATTSGRGIAKLKDVPLGNHKVTITKKYYQTVEENVSVGFSGLQKSFEMEAQGNLVNITTKNKISGAPLEGVEIKAGEAQAKTDENGETVLVLPFDTKEIEAEASLDKFVSVKTKISASDKEVKTAEINLVSSGKIYFLSKSSGRIDVVKSNLDGSDRKIVLAGTGKEDEADTALLVSTDWKYLALKSRRDGGENAKLFLIETANDSISGIDEGNANFSLYGWSGKHLVYEVDRKINSGQKEKYRLKSFDAESKKINVLDRSQAVFEDNGYGGSSQPQDRFSYVVLAQGKVLYLKLWDDWYYNAAQGNNYAISVNPDGSDKKVLFQADTNKYNGYIQDLFLYRPDEIYAKVYDYDASKEKYFEWHIGDKSIEEVTDDNEKNKFNQQYPTFLISPSGKENLWSEERDGKNVVFIGDVKAEHEKEIARLSEYQQYGWYTDDYLLFSKKGSELYIMARSGLDNEKEPVKISDYHRPTYRYYGYGGGYGGF